jgi:hypothetical protein
MTVRVCIQLLALKHCWNISAGSCLIILLAALILLKQLPPVYLPEKLVEITALRQ